MMWRKGKDRIVRREKARGKKGRMDTKEGGKK
jgi:hypothetical protein